MNKKISLKISLLSVAAIIVFGVSSIFAKQKQDIFDAIKAGDVKEVKRMVNQKIVNVNDLENGLNADKQTPVAYACMLLSKLKGQPVSKVKIKNNAVAEIADFLIKNSSILSGLVAADKMGHTPLYWAVVNNQPEIVRLIVQKGTIQANRNIVTKEYDGKPLIILATTAKTVTDKPGMVRIIAAASGNAANKAMFRQMLNKDIETELKKHKITNPAIWEVLVVKTRAGNK